MVDRKEPVALRNKRLFRSVIARSGPMKRSTDMKMTQDALLDAFILLFDECSKESLRKDAPVTNFINKYRNLVSEIKSLRVSLDDFSMQAVIGRGHFGEVRVVKEKQTSDIYAMKILKKSKTVGSESASLFEEEHDIMCTNISPWLTSLQYSFQDNENLYFVMEYHPGGDLLSLLDRYNGTFTLEMTKFYLAEIALAVRALHQMGYVHRDIKPDNILLDRCGHVKLADFGSAARLTASGTVNQTMPVGTPEYIAPEILFSLNSDCADKRKKCCYGIECDYWSLGILAYEMVLGRTPFSSAELKVTYHNIMNHKKLKYSENSKVPEALQDLINKLLDDPSTRIKHEGLTKHPFFIGIDWHNIRNEAPPFVPTLMSAEDTSNFLELERKKSTPKIHYKESRKDFSGKDLPFIGFTFSNDTNNEDGQGLNDSYSERKESSLDSVLAKIRRENQNLVSKLCEAEFGKTSEREKLEKELEEKSKLCSFAEADRTRLMREVAKAQAENANLRRTLEFERQDRKDMETNALNLIVQNKRKIERDMGNLISQLNSKIEKLYDELTESHTINNELSSKCDRTETELTAAKNEIEILKSLEASYKEKTAKARELKRQSVVGLESRIEQLANENYSQSNILQQKLSEEIQAKTEAIEKLKEMETVWSGKEAQLREEIKEYEDKVQQLEMKISTQHSEIASLQVRLEEKPNMVLLEQKLEAEKNECALLRQRVAHMEAELTNTTNSFIDHESAIAAHEESMNALERELRQVSEEKIELQKKLQKTKEIEEENRQKLSSLEIVVDRLEEGVIKLESENANLKQQLVAYSQPITSEAETRYQERITILEDQLAKLENQLQTLRESSLLDKESLKSTQKTLWKTEKELSDAKIDIRIAKRETKTAEETVARLKDELKKAVEKMNTASQKSSDEIAAERERHENLTSEIGRLKGVISEKEWEMKVLKNQLEDFEELKKSNKELKKEYNEMCQSCKILEKQVSVLKDERENLRESYQNLEMVKVKLESAIEEMKHKVCSLELNNTVLKETGAMMDEQLEDYEKFTASQSQKIERLQQEKSDLEKELETAKTDLRNCRQSLNEEKWLRSKVEQTVASLESKVETTEENLASMKTQLAEEDGAKETLKDQVKDLESKVASYELDMQEWRRMYDALDAECQWLKQETTTHLTNLYSLRESNYKLTLNLEEEQQLVTALQERISDMQNYITELEAFHKQREVKDEATKQQQNKLISFLQSKLDDEKKKKTLSDVLFGSRTKENFPPNSGWTSPRSTKTLSDIASTKTLKEPIEYPGKRKPLTPVLKPPAGRSQRQSPAQKARTNVPHRFKSQLIIRGGKCGNCHASLVPWSRMSVCSQCGVQAHPKCAITYPKTCDLSDRFAKPNEKTLNGETNEFDTKPVAVNSPSSAIHEGWIKIPKMDDMTWEKVYAKLGSESLEIYGDKPQDGSVAPRQRWDLSSANNQIVVGEVTDFSGLPSTAKCDLPYIIKIAVVPENKCWPKEVHYMMVLTAGDKPAWLTALNEIILKVAPVEKIEYTGSKIYAFFNENLHLKFVSHISDKLLLLGGERGLFSLRVNSENAEPTKIGGVSKVKQLSIADQIGLVLMIVEDDGMIVETDYRALVSNAEALSCTNPAITTTPISLGSAVESCLLFSLSEKIDGTFYLTAATPTRLILLRWNMKNSQFIVSRVLETLHPCNCILYTDSSVIVGCDKFFRISLKDFTVQEFLDPSITSLAFWRIGSFPIQIFEVCTDEILLCYNEFGVFVNRKGEKIQSDLKWSKVPVQFAFRKPYLYVVHKTSVEVIAIPRPDSAQSQFRSNEDSISTASTATIRDSVHINFENPYYLGSSKIPGAIIISNTVSPNETDLIVIDGKNVLKNELGSCMSLSTIADEIPRNDSVRDEFSFSSSLANSVFDAGCSTPRLSDESDSCNTYTIAETHKTSNSKKVVSFVQHTVL